MHCHCHLHHVPCTMYPAPCTLHHVPCTMYPAPCTLHHVPCTMYPAPCTLHHVPARDAHHSDTFLVTDILRSNKNQDFWEEINFKFKGVLGSNPGGILQFFIFPLRSTRHRYFKKIRKCVCWFVGIHFSGQLTRTTLYVLVRVIVYEYSAS